MALSSPLWLPLSSFPCLQNKRDCIKSLLWGQNHPLSLLVTFWSIFPDLRAAFHVLTLPHSAPPWQLLLCPPGVSSPWVHRCSLNVSGLPVALLSTHPGHSHPLLWLWEPLRGGDSWSSTSHQLQTQLPSDWTFCARLCGRHLRLKPLPDQTLHPPPPTRCLYPSSDYGHFPALPASEGQMPGPPEERETGWQKGRTERTDGSVWLHPHCLVKT